MADDDAPGSAPSIERFIQQYWEDFDRGEVQSLPRYLTLFPEDPDGVAREYLVLKEHEKQASEGPRTTPGHIGHYRILRELGGGGQGVVYLARDLRLGREVAIKKLRGAYSLTGIDRLRREAKIASRLDHPGICPIYEIGDHDGDPYFVMRYVDGGTLSARIGALRDSASTTFTFVSSISRRRSSRRARRKPLRPRRLRRRRPRRRT
jgi:serine/threonine protein kinase